MLALLRGLVSNKRPYTLDTKGQKAVNKAIGQALGKALGKILPQLVRSEVKAAINASLAFKPPRLAAGVVQYSPAVAQRGLGDYRAILHMGDAMPGSLVAYREWRDAIKASGVHVIVLFRHLPRYQSASAQYPEDDFVYARTDVDVDQVVKLCSNLTACFATTLTGNLLTMMRYDNIRTIFIGHGDSDKVSSSRRGMRAFDEIWIAGDAHRDRLSSVLMGTPLRVVGRPQIKSLITSNPSTARSACYLPTWEGNLEESNYSSLAIAHEIISVIAKVSNDLTVKLHPSSGFRVKEYLEGEFAVLPEGAGLVPSAESPMPIMADASFCVADVSSIISDYLATGRPIFVFDAGKAKLETRLPLEEYCYTFRTGEELGDLLKRVIVDKNDTLREARFKAAGYLVSREATLADAFATALRQAQY